MILCLIVKRHESYRNIQKLLFINVVIQIRFFYILKEFCIFLTGPGNSLATLLNGPATQDLLSGSNNVSNENVDIADTVKAEATATGPGEMTRSSSMGFAMEQKVKVEPMTTTPGMSRTATAPALKSEVPAIKVPAAVSGQPGLGAGATEPKSKKVWTPTELCSAFLELHRRMSDESVSIISILFVSGFLIPVRRAALRSLCIFLRLFFIMFLLFFILGCCSIPQTCGYKRVKYS